MEQTGAAAVSKRFLRDQLFREVEIKVRNQHQLDYRDWRDKVQDERPVIGMSVAYASAVGAGGWALVLPNQWENLDNLRRIPDTVDEFTGYFIDVDFFALSFPGNPLDKRYENHGTANVRNVVLPAAYNHVMVPLTQALARDPQVRNWINDYRPGKSADPSALPGDAALHVLWAADVWYSIKKHWCLEAQRLIRAKRAALAQN